ncbi:MAG: CNNM domain-containing protein [Acidobacteriota bacterium]
MGSLIAVVVLTLFLSGQCSLFEAVLYSTRMSTLEASRKRDERRVLAERFMRMRERIAVPIAAILILNTVANTAGAAMAGMYAARLFGPSKVALFSGCLTVAILFFSEVLPKTVGAVYWKIIWPFVVWPITLLQWALYPGVWITQKFAGLFTRGADSPGISEDEILALVHLGAKLGEISHAESRMVQNIIELENKRVRDIMTPRPVVFMLDASISVDDAVPLVVSEGFTRVPIFERERENVTAYVMVQDLIAAQNRGLGKKSLSVFGKSVAFVPKSVNCLTMLTNFLTSRSHIAVALDEYGGIAGVVTLEDLIETLLGAEIVDERDRVVDLQETARKRWESNNHTED